MASTILLEGIAAGLAIAAPVGPVGVLCVRRTLTQGRRYGILSGLGAASADAIYGGVAGFGVNCVSDFLIKQQVWMGLIGGVFLLCLGYRTFRAKPAEPTAPAHKASLLVSYASTLVLTLTNPLSIIGFVAVFASLGLTKVSASWGSAAVLVLGVFIGSAMWWLSLAGGVGVFKRRFNTNGLRWVNRISGVIIAGCGVLALLGSFFRKP